MLEIEECASHWCLLWTVQSAESSHIPAYLIKRHSVAGCGQHVRLWRGCIPHSIGYEVWKHHGPLQEVGHEAAKQERQPLSGEVSAHLATAVLYALLFDIMHHTPGHT
jgi:hypothetical protein